VEHVQHERLFYLAAQRALIFCLGPVSPATPVSITSLIFFLSFFFVFSVFALCTTAICFLLGCDAPRPFHFSQSEKQKTKAHTEETNNPPTHIYIHTCSFFFSLPLRYLQMLRLSLRRWCAAAATAVSSTAPTPSAAARKATLPDFYGRNFTVAPRTWEQINKKNSEEGFTNDARHLRLAIDSGGCHGYLYKFSFEPVAQFNAEEDVLITESDVVSPADETFTGAEPSPRVVVDTLSVSKLEKATLDFHSELKGSAFVVVGNELVDQSCACAMSFSLKKKKAQGSASAGSASGKHSGDGSSGSHAVGLSVAGGLGSNARPITRHSAGRGSS
jgi:iron-sulfur cluster assembly 2